VELVEDEATGRTSYVGLGFHDLRRANATGLVADGVDIKTAQAMLGHSNVQTDRRALRPSRRQDRCGGRLVDGHPVPAPRIAAAPMSLSARRIRTPAMTLAIAARLIHERP